MRVARRGGYASTGANGRSHRSSAKDDGFEVTAWPSQGGRGAADRLSLSLGDDELELLLLHAPALHHRMRSALMHAPGSTQDCFLIKKPAV